MPSPICLVKDGAGAFEASFPRVEVTPGNTVTIKLNSPSGVESWDISCISTDELGDAATINAGLTVSIPAFEATFTAPAAGSALIFESRVNGGLNPQRQQDPDYVSAFKIITLTSEGKEVMALGEESEGNQDFGWLGVFNDLIRNPPIGGVQVIVNIQDYGAVCDGVTDDSDAWDACMADVPIRGIDVIEVPQTVGGCAISRPIRMCSTDPNYLMNGVTIRGQLDTVAVAPALTYLVWLVDQRSGSSASLVSTANDIEPGADYLGITWTHFLLSGCTGANFTAADVGTTGVRISNAANPLLNATVRITKYVSPTSVYVGMQNLGALSDANNGTIGWIVLDSMIYMQGRALAVENLSPFIASGKYVYNFLSFTHPTGESSQLSVTGCTASRISVQPAGTGVCENLLEVGQWIVPTTTQVGWLWTFQTAANGQYRPWGPYQCDYFELKNATIINYGSAYEGACIRSANPSGQSRANIAHDIGAIGKEYVTLERSDFPNSNGPASSSWTIHHMTGGGITKALVGRTSGQAQFTVNQLSCEQGAAVFISYGLANAITSTVFNGAYYFSVNSGLYAYDPVGIFQVTDGSYLSLNDCEFELSGLDLPGGYFLDANNSGRANITFTNCNLPDPSGYGLKELRDMFNLRGYYAKVNITNCMTYLQGNDGLSALGNISFVGGAYVAGANINTADRFGDSLLMRGTSNSLFTASNYFGVVTISGATETRKTWEFVDPEIDEDYEGHYYEILPTLLYSSGTVAAAAIPVDIQKARRSCTLELGAPPGGGASVTYGLRLIRHNQAPITAFHPQDIPDLYFYFDAEYDVGYNVAISPELQDNITGRLYWRNQASRRGLAYTNISACDAFAATTGGADDATALPSTATDAAFNNKYVATTTTSKRMFGLMHGTEACASPFTMFVVGTAGTGAGDKCPFQLWDGSNGKTAEFLNNGTTTYLYIDGVTTLNTAHTWTTPAVVCGVANGASSALYISSITATATGTAGTLTTGADDYFIIGANNTYSRYWSGTGGGAVGKIAAILVYKGALSTADRTSVTNWLGARYGITIAP